MFKPNKLFFGRFYRVKELLSHNGCNLVVMPAKEKIDGHVDSPYCIKQIRPQKFSLRELVSRGRIERLEKTEDVGKAIFLRRKKLENKLVHTF